MKFLSDMFPVLLFFVAYYVTKNMYIATGVAMAAQAGQIGYAWLRGHKIDTMQWISLGLIVVMGGATLLFHDKHFIMWKPTVLYWIMGIALLVSEFTGKNGLKMLMGQQIELPQPVWRKLTVAWFVFFILMGGLNIFIAYQFSESVWVNFKLFGGIGLMVVFVIAQSLFLSKYIEEKK